MKNIALFILLVLATSCVDELGTDAMVENPTSAEDCEGDIFCTMEFRLFGPTIEDADGEPITLESDRVSAYYTATEEEIEVSISEFADETHYYIASDGDMDKIDFAGTSITFEAKVAPFRTIKREFIVAKNCCHIYNPEGQDLEIVLE